MNNFTLVQRTKVIFGKDVEKTIGKEVRKFSTNCLIVNDGGSYLSKLISDIKDSLSKENIDVYELKGVRVNPLKSKCDDGIELCRSKKIKFILSVGGGSVMDTGKYIAVGVNSTIPVIEYNPATIVNHAVLHHGVISTLSGSGSEFSACSMMVNDSVNPNEKMCLINEAFFNDFAIIDPQLVFSLPPKQTACGAMDVISHCLETYLVDDKTAELSDYYFEGIIKTVLENAPIAFAKPNDYQARANMCIASNMAMIPNISYAGIKGDWAVHAFENPVTCRYQRTHGEIIGIMTLAYMKWCCENGMYLEKLEKWAVKCMNADENFYCPKNTIRKGIKNLEDWLSNMKMPITLSQIGINYLDLDSCAKQCAPAGAVSKYTTSQIMGIYEFAK